MSSSANSSRLASFSVEEKGYDMEKCVCSVQLVPQDMVDDLVKPI